jgi:hypothetical protein
MRLVCALVAVFAVCGLATGCGGASNALATSSSVCFRALPMARAAVEGQGTFDGVRLVTAASFSKEVNRKLSGERSKLDLAVRTSGEQQLCIFAFRGRYQAAAVAGDVAGTKGDFAVVLVGARHLRLVASVVVNRLPQRFSHPGIHS